MAFIEWTDTYSLGIPAIDEQHQRLVAMLNSLYEASIGLRGQAALREIVAGMTEYATTHFRYEEKLMERFGYPDRAAHQAEHRVFTEEARKIQERLDAGTFVSSIETLKFLKKWLVEHIVKTDKRYGPCFAEHRGETGAA